MDARELRVGNLVNEEVLGDCLVETIFKTGQIEISVNNLTKEGVVNKRCFIFNIDNFQPIPLTEERLVKFGFVYHSDYNALQKMGFSIENRATDKLSTNINKDEFGVWYINSYLREVKHVHQLQNLYFALTGEELTTK
tara:strand:+ start:37 stop:450 length:414 start_codon:yes stop_codon:yes gene_type:complete